jgi:hypothetical protein
MPVLGTGGPQVERKAMWCTVFQIRIGFNEDPDPDPYPYPDPDPYTGF